MIDRIIFTTDFSPFSKEAFRYTLALARKTGAQIIATYALKVPSPVYSVAFSLEEHKAELEESARAKLKSFFRKDEYAGVEVELRLCEGLPEQALNDLAREVKAHLVVAARHSRSSLERFFMGSTTERILRETRFPLLVLPDHGPRTLSWKPILCAIDFSKASKDALHFSIQMARRHESELNVIHVVDMGVGVESIASDAFKSRLGLIRERAKEQLQEMVKTHGAPSGTKSIVVEGAPASSIVRQAEEMGSDLLVIGERGHTLLERMVIGSTANAILRSAHVPVLVVPAGYSL